MIATSSGVARSTRFSFTSAPAASSAFTDAHVAFAHREHERCRPRVRSLADVGASFDERLDDSGVPFGGGPLQRRLSVPAFTRVDLRAGDAAAACTASTLPARAACINGVSSALMKFIVSFGSAPAFINWPMMVALPLFRRERHRRHTVVVLDVHVRAGADEQRGRFRVFGVHGPVQRGRAVRLRRVDVGLLRQQRLDRLLILALAASASGAGCVGAAMGRAAPPAGGGCVLCAATPRPAATTMAASDSPALGLSRIFMTS